MKTLISIKFLFLAAVTAGLICASPHKSHAASGNLNDLASGCDTYYLEEHPMTSPTTDPYPIYWPVIDYVPGAPVVCLSKMEYWKISNAFDQLDYVETFIRNDDKIKEPGSTWVWYSFLTFKNHPIYFPISTPPAMGQESWVTKNEMDFMSKGFAMFYEQQKKLQSMIK